MFSPVVLLLNSDSYTP